MQSRYSINALGSKHNLCGEKIREYRLSQQPKMSQRMLADNMQILGFEMDKNTIQRIESGKRFVTDIELKAFSELLKIPIDDLIK